ncbi:MAG: TrkA C-terminal domain-containing protein [Bacteroidales bacterium]|nr:TrkA C-terminal domain-containing protein [Bacteroidales bacterium]MCF8343597.1 TrkA C-terminal domain-containing protein [Bacteroidales bacterium]MCF8377706.1 TrkA C-terminal domain-containing protein [Bacteroidales bacterium]MCF8402097.1 TrkA C-terminal domain-containing protein [Bacteroidales bacterium]
MVPLLSVILILIFSIIITKVATAALVNTGLSQKAAKFQARSAFTGCGFTTSEAEKITQHPIRRKIVQVMMLLGNAGIVTVIASLLLTFVNQDEKSLPAYFNLIIIAGSVILLAIITSSRSIDKWLDKVINMTLGKITKLNIRDYSALHKLSYDFQIAELHVRKEDWINGKKVSECIPEQCEVKLLGIEKPTWEYIGFPKEDHIIEENDLLILYGREGAIRELDVKEK